ncbi:MAG: glycosyltransferase family 9 protein [Bacteroidia bacterium]
MKLLILQTAFIGDVILATSLVEKLHQFHPIAEIDFLLRKGNESLLEGHPYIHQTLVWDKKKNKLKNLFLLHKKIEKEKYDVVINLQRFASSGFLIAFSGAKQKIGFEKNPFSFLFTTKIKHEIGGKKYEIDRNQELIKALTDGVSVKPKLYPSKNNFLSVEKYKTQKYFCIAPASIWFTKQFPKEKWIELIKNSSIEKKFFLLGSPTDYDLCEYIKIESGNKNVENLAGKINFLESAALMRDAEMNYVNDSAPLHIASAMNAPVTAIFCSTVPSFGFGPLSDNARVVEINELLDCRPCGLHGHAACPKKHFKCALGIDVKQLL